MCIKNTIIGKYIEGESILSLQKTPFNKKHTEFFVENEPQRWDPNNMDKLIWGVLQTNF